MKTLALILILIAVPLNGWATECYDYKKDGWRLGEELCGSSCYDCNSEDHAKQEVKYEYEKYFPKQDATVKSKRQKFTCISEESYGLAPKIHCGKDIGDDLRASLEEKK